MELGLKGKRVLVTAASRGIGRAIAFDFAKEGARVAAVARTESEIFSLVEEMGGKEKGHYGRAIDLSSEGAPAKLVQSLKENFGPVDIVVHNLGAVLDIRDPFCSLADWRKVWRVNIEVAIELDQLLLPHMREQKWGRVVHIASTASMENNGPITYCTAKAALMAYSHGLGRILAKDGVVMTAVLPGAVFTSGGDWDNMLKTRPEHVQKYLNDRCPLGRFGKPEEISSIVVFLSSELATFFQGAVVPVDGGQSRHYFVNNLE